LTDFFRLTGRRVKAHRRKASSGEKVNFNGSFAHDGRLAFDFIAFINMTLELNFPTGNTIGDFYFLLLKLRDLARMKFRLIALMLNL